MQLATQLFEYRIKYFDKQHYDWKLKVKLQARILAVFMTTK